jgi:hypothetical protein
VNFISEQILTTVDIDVLRNAENGCFPPEDRSNKIYLASTWNPMQKRGDSTVPLTAQIQICPWFLEWARGKHYKNMKDLHGNPHWGKVAIDFFSRFNWPYTQIGILNLSVMISSTKLTFIHRCCNSSGQGIIA